jgi:hypothetical protein
MVGSCDGSTNESRNGQRFFCAQAARHERCSFVNTAMPEVNTRICAPAIRSSHPSMDSISCTGWKFGRAGAITKCKNSQIVKADSTP